MIVRNHKTNYMCFVFITFVDIYKFPIRDCQWLNNLISAPGSNDGNIWIYILTEIAWKLLSFKKNMNTEQ